MVRITGPDLDYAISRSRVESKSSLLAIIKSELPQNASQYKFTICVGNERLPWNAYDLPASDFSVEVSLRAGKLSLFREFP